MTQKRNNKVLIVDDEQDIANSLKTILEGPSTLKKSLTNKAKKLFESMPNNKVQNSLETSVTVAYSGKEGIKKVEEFKKNGEFFALLIIDIKMPEMNGVEASKIIRSIDPKIEIIFITAYNDFTIFEINEVIGNNISYITKPFRPEEVISFTNKSISEWNSKSEMTKMADDISKNQTSLILDLRDDNKKTKETLINFQENIILLFKKYFRLKSLAVFEKGNDENFNVIHEYNIEMKEISKKFDLSSFLTESPQELIKNHSLACIQIGKLYFIFEPENKILSSSEHFFLELISKLSQTLLNELYLENKIKVDSRLSKLGENIGAITHDIKLTLNNLMNAATKAQQSISNQNEVLNNLSYIYSTCQDFESFLWHIQETIKSPTLKKEKIHLYSIIEELKESISYLKLSHPNLSFIFPEKAAPTVFYGETKSLKRVFLNIIQNSINSFQEGKNKSAIMQKIEFSYELNQEEIIFIINDNGPGVKEELKNKLFKPLSTFDSPFDIGLGTSIAHDIISNHKGNISFTSKPGETIVRVSLPMS